VVPENTKATDLKENKINNEVVEPITEPSKEPEERSFSSMSQDDENSPKGDRAREMIGAARTSAL
jgi:hypothetical protein